MDEIPGDLRFLPTHEWARLEDDGRVTVGISEHAQAQLGDLVYIELPTVGDSVQKGASCAVVESVKAASDIYSPVTGEIVAVNEVLGDSPEILNQDAFGEGWLFVVEATKLEEFDELMAPDEYAESLDEH